MIWTKSFGLKVISRKKKINFIVKIKAALHCLESKDNRFFIL